MVQVHMFSIFKSDRQKWKEQAEATFKVCIPSLKGMSDEEIAFSLDFAANIRRASTSALSENDRYVLAFNDPMLLNEAEAFLYLQHWKDSFLKLGDTELDRAKVGALTVWWLSLAGVAIPEYRIQAREMWGELSRGFKYCTVFIPNEMVPRGLEPFNMSDSPSHEVSLKSIFIKTLNMELECYELQNKIPDELKKEIIEFEIKMRRILDSVDESNPQFDKIVAGGLPFYAEHINFCLKGVIAPDPDCPMQKMYNKYDLAYQR